MSKITLEFRSCDDLGTETIRSERLQNNGIASAELSLSFEHSSAYLTTRGEEGPYTSPSGSLACTIIEDYRSNTVFDAVGSIGGFLALVQGLHILLFGRPLFWGILGSRLINPLGLCGMCHSKSFRRRLREKYRYQPSDTGTPGSVTKDPIETIRVGAFLNDFVVEFGPLLGAEDKGETNGEQEEKQALKGEDTRGFGDTKESV
ncbi:deuterolysin metalloprotease (M35) family containing protein [Ceratobasidium sp. AG-Ba]|nr:deuterolysin metalloprotease (M35) family containing protein [Ceratobasidium sp. AG-Ba]